MFKWKTKKKRKVQGSQGNDDVDDKEDEIEAQEWDARSLVKEKTGILYASVRTDSFHLQSHFHFSLVFTVFLHRDFNNEGEWKTSKIYNLKEQEKEFFSSCCFDLCSETWFPSSLFSVYDCLASCFSCTPRLSSPPLRVMIVIIIVFFSLSLS